MASPLHQLPDVGRIEGVRVEPSPLNDPVAAKVEVQYSVRGSDTWQSLKMPMLDALYLLNLLEAMSQQLGIDHLRRKPPKQSG